MRVQVIERGGVVRGEMESIDAALPLLHVINSIERRDVALVVWSASGRLAEVLAWWAE